MLRCFFVIGACYALCLAPLKAEENDPILKPYNGPSKKGVNASTLSGKVMCGYQGWFNCEGDGADLNWVHWAASVCRKEGSWTPVAGRVAS